MEEANASEAVEKMATDVENPQIIPEIGSEKCACGLTNISEFYEIKATAETYKNNVDEIRANCSQQVEELSLKYQDEAAKLTASQKCVQELRTELDETRREVTTLSETLKQIEVESADYRKDRNSVIDERDSLLKMVDRRNFEVQRLQNEIEVFKKQLQEAVNTRCEALNKYEEVKHQEMNLKFKENRLDQEKDLMQKQIASLTEDLNRNIRELQNVRREATMKSVNTETKLCEKTEELKVANSAIAHLTDNNNMLSSKVEDLSVKLLAHNEEAGKMMEYYKKELGAQTKLANLYKDASEDSTSQLSEMANAVTELKAMLKEATDEYGVLETKMKSFDVKHEQELEDKNKELSALQIELKNANELLKASQADYLEQAVQTLCPTAASTSKMLQSGKSLTEIYSMYVEAKTALGAMCKENTVLNLRIQEMVNEIEEQAPFYRQREIEGRRAIQENEELKHQLQKMVDTRAQVIHERDSATSGIKRNDKEIRQLRTERSDLSRQVCFLLRQVEELRGGGMMVDRDQSVHENSSSEEFISKKLVTFADIQEMQENNAKLIALVRNLTAHVEELEDAKSIMDQASFESKLEMYAKRLKDMQESTDYQTRMMDKCIQMRDRYKKQYQDLLKQTSNNSGSSSLRIPASFNGSLAGGTDMMDVNDDAENTPCASTSGLSDLTSIADKERKIGNLEAKIKETEEQLKVLKEEYETYRKEKLTNDKMLNEQFDTMRTELREMSTSNCKLLAQVEHQTEQLKLQQKNCLTYKKQIQTLEERNKIYETTIIKHETSLQYLRDDSLNSQSKLSRAEVQVEQLIHENRILKDKESRLQSEREMLYRERQSQNLLNTNLQFIKNSLERSEADDKQTMQKTIENMTRELSALRRRLQEEQDRFRELTSHLERQTKSAQDKMEVEKAVADKCRDEIVALRTEIEQKGLKIEKLSTKLQESLTPTESDNPIAIANKKVRDLMLQLQESQVEIDSLQKELLAAREHSKQYCNMADATQKEIDEMRIQHNEFRQKIEADLAHTRKQENHYREKYEEAATEISLDLANSRLNAGGDPNTELHKAQTELKESLLKISENNRDLRDLRDRCDQLQSSLDAAETKYGNEMLLHSNDIKVMSMIKEDMHKMRQQMNDMKLAKDLPHEHLVKHQQILQEREQFLTNEKLQLEKRIEDLDKQNTALHDQLQALSTRLSINVSQQDDSMNDSTVASTTIANTSVTDDEKPSDQLLQIIKYLRKEKDIAMAKFDILRTENARLKAEKDLVAKQVEEMEAALNLERTSNESGSLNATKHEELLRKVETLNAITDSNRVLREERDALSSRVSSLTERVTKVEDELFPLKEQNHELVQKADLAAAENASLRGEATRWRQRANSLVERSNKNSPDDWKRLQGERENLAKMLQTEKDQHKKTTEEFNSIKIEKAKLDNEIVNLTRQVGTLSADNKKHVEELLTLRQSSLKMVAEITEIRSKMNVKDDDIKRLSDELVKKEEQLTDSKNKETQIRKIAKRYKDSYTELQKTQIDGGSAPKEATGELETSAASTAPSDSNDTKIQELTAEITKIQAHLAALRQENELLKARAAKAEEFKNFLNQAKLELSKITNEKQQMAQQLLGSKSQLQACEQSREEHNTVITGMKSQWEARLARQEKELSDQLNDKMEVITRLQRENETLQMRVNQLHRQVGMQQSSKPTTSDKSPSDPSPRMAVKPMAGSSTQQSATVQPWRGSSNDTPLASIRPISVSRTAAVMPNSQTVVSIQGAANTSTTSSSTSSGPTTALVPPQQQVHTTGNQPGEAMSSSPTSSHTDYMPATSSATSSVVIATIPPMGSGSNDVQTSSSSSSQSQEAEVQVNESIQVVTGTQQQPQAVALVSPRVESAPQNLNLQPVQEPSQAPSTSGSSASNPQPVSNNHASSSNTVTTSQAGIHKRPRDVEGDSSTSTDDVSDKTGPLKRKRLGDIFQTTGVSESGLDYEYQVPTSSQRDQEDDIIVVDTDDEDEDESMNEDGPFDEENEGFQMENYEQEQEVVGGYADIDDDNIQSANNEVEIEDVSEVPNQSGSVIPVASDAASTSGIGQSSSSTANNSPVSDPSTLSDNPQQIQSITSGTGNEAGASTSSPSSASTSQWRQNPNITSRQHQSSHLMLMHQNYDETPDDRIVPSTPTLYANRRSDGYSEVEPSPHPQSHSSRFTFSDSASSAVPTRSINLEGMDDTRIDLSSMDEQGSGVVAGSSQATPPSSSPGDNTNNDSTSASTSSSSSSVSTVVQQLSGSEQAGSSSQGESQVPNIRITPAEEGFDEANDGASTSEATPDDKQSTSSDQQADEDDVGDGVSSEGEKQSSTDNNEDDTSEADVLDQPSSNTRNLRSVNVRGNPINAVRSRGMGRGSPRQSMSGRPIPITWGEAQQQRANSMSPQRGMNPNVGRPSGRARRSRGSRGPAQGNYANRF